MIALKVLTFTCLLSLTRASENVHLNSLIRRAYSETNSATVLFVEIDDEFLSDFLKNNCDIPVSVVLNHPVLENSTSFYTNTIFVTQIANATYPQTIFQKLISKLRLRQFVIISAPNMDHLEMAFTYFSENKFTRIYGVVQGIQYAYLPFAEKRIQVLSANTELIDAYQNLHGFNIRTTLQKDIPRVFSYPSKNEPQKIGGCFGKAFKFFLRTYNATYKRIQIENCTDLCMSKIFDATLNNQIDISANVYSSALIPGLDPSYPVKNVVNTLLVPVIDYLDTNQYFLRPFSCTVWIFIGIILIYLVLMDFFINNYLSLDASNADVWRSFRQIFLMMLALPAGRQLTQNYRFYIQVMVIAFILNNIYMNFFTSFLTVFIKIDQFDSKQDFYAHNVRILLPFFEWNRTAYTGTYPENFEELFKPVPLGEYTTQRNALNNTRYAYLTDSDRAEFLIQLQSLFSKPLFRIIRRPLNTVHLCYVLPKHSPFKYILDKYIIYLQQSGLMEKWDRAVLLHSLRAKFDGIANREPNENPLHTPLSLEHLAFAWNTLAIGMSFALMMFVGEILTETLKNRFGLKKYVLTMKTKISVLKNRKL